MSRSSPGVWRVAAILNFIADHPGQAFALTDLVRALKLSRATCHALLTGLVEVGYLYRTTDKTYVLGPALTAIGLTAAEHFSPLQVAKPEMRSIADAYDVVCAAYFLEGDMMHLRDRAASASHVAYPVPLGMQMKLRSTQAAVYHAWSPKDAEVWLEGANPRPSPDKIALMFEAWNLPVRMNLSSLCANPGWCSASPTNERLSSAETDDLPVVPCARVDAGSVYPVAALMAPVFDARAMSALRWSWPVFMRDDRGAGTGGRRSPAIGLPPHLRFCCRARRAEFARETCRST